MVKITMRPIIPKGIDPEKYVAAWENVLRRKTGRALQRDFFSTTETWAHKPGFPIMFERGRDFMKVSVFATGQHAARYGWVSNGVAGRKITAKNPTGLLSFRPGYRARTMRHSIRSGAQSRSGPYIRKPSVKWPGIEAREFDITIAGRQRQPFYNDIRNATALVARS